MTALWLEDRGGLVLLHSAADSRELPGLVGRRILAWHRAQAARGADWAAGYLQGVADGLALQGDAAAVRPNAA